MESEAYLAVYLAAVRTETNYKNGTDRYAFD